MKVLLIDPGAPYSTADVAAGLRHGLLHHGVEVVDYRLTTRIERARGWLYYNWRRAKKQNATIDRPTVADVYYQAGVGAIERGLRAGVDVVLAVSGMFLHPDVVILMRRAGLRVVVLFTESPYDTDPELALARLVDGCWTNERCMVDAFRAVNRHAGYLPHAWHPGHHRSGPQPGDEAVPAHDVVFVGSGFADRVTWLSAIDWAGLDLGLYGQWQAIGPRHPLRSFVRGGIVSNTQAAALYRRCRIALNLYRTRQGWAPDGPPVAAAESLNPRAYELARCGVFHLSSPRAEVREVFGDLVPEVGTPEATSALVRRWLTDIDGRAEVARSLPACVAESSWIARAATVIGDLQTMLPARAA